MPIATSWAYYFAAHLSHCSECFLLGILCIRRPNIFFGVSYLAAPNGTLHYVRGHCHLLGLLCQAGQALPARLATLSLQWLQLRPLGNGQQGGAKMSPFSKHIHTLRADKHENSRVCTFRKLLEPRGGTHGEPGLGPHGGARDKLRRMNAERAATPDKPLSTLVCLFSVGKGHQAIFSR